MDNNQEPHRPNIPKKSLALILIGAFGLVSIITALIVIGAVYFIITKTLPSDNRRPATVETQSYQQDLDAIMASHPPTLGNSDAPVTIIEFADFQCPYCKEFHDRYLPLLKTNYIDTGKIRFAFQHYPFLGTESNLAAEAALCAEKQGLFWAYHDGLYKRQAGENVGNFNQMALLEIAQEANVSEEVFTTCVAQHETASALDNQLARADKLGVIATPTLFINGKKYEGVKSYAYLETLINQALEQK